MKTWERYILERDERRDSPHGGYDFPDRNSFAKKGPISTAREIDAQRWAYGTTKNVWQDRTTGKVYQVPGNLRRVAGEWWMDVAEYDPTTGKKIRVQQEPIMDLLPNLKPFNEMPPATNN